MISERELKKQVDAINRQTRQDIAELLYDRWFYLLNTSSVDSSVVSLCCLYCEEVFSKIFGCLITSVHDLFIDLKYEDKDIKDLIFVKDYKI